MQGYIGLSRQKAANVIRKKTFSLLFILLVIIWVSQVVLCDYNHLMNHAVALFSDYLQFAKYYSNL